MATRHETTRVRFKAVARVGPCFSERVPKRDPQLPYRRSPRDDVIWLKRSRASR